MKIAVKPTIPINDLQYDPYFKDQIATYIRRYWRSNLNTYQFHFKIVPINETINKINKTETLKILTYDSNLENFSFCVKAEPAFDIVNFIDKTDLGEIYIGQKDTLTAKDIIAKIKTKNHYNTKYMNDDDIKIEKIEDNKCVVVANNQYSGVMNITYQTKKFKNIPIIGNIIGVTIIYDLLKNDDYLYIATNSGLYQLKIDKDNVESIFDNHEIKAITMDKNNEVFYFAANDTIYQYTENKVSQILLNNTTINTLWVNSLINTNDNNLYIILKTSDIFIIDSKEKNI